MLFAAAVALSIPLHFEPNRGQAPAPTRYVAAAPEYSLFLSDTDVTMRFPRTAPLRMNFPQTRVEAVGPLPGKTNYYLGVSPSTWHTNVPNYARAQYHSIFPGVDLVIYGKAQQVEYDWVVAPQADPGAIWFSFSGASRMRLDAAGDLVLDTAAGEVRNRKPYIYQSDQGRIRRIDGGFELARGGKVRFRVGPYDRRLPLVIDPKLVYAAGFGGSGTQIDWAGNHSFYSDTGTGIAVDRSGNVYVAGTTFSADFPLVDALGPGPARSCLAECLYQAIFVAKLSADGTTLLYSTYIAAPPALQAGTNYPYGPELPAGIALDPSGTIYVTGTTSGANFPKAGQTTTAGELDAFVMELDVNGALLASTLIGGSGDDAGSSLALGSDGSLYLAGTTLSADFPTTSGAYRTAPLTSGQNIFLAKIAPSPAAGAKPASLSIVYSTYLGPGDSPVVAVDSSGDAYVAGSTTSAAWNTTSAAAQPQCAGSSCADVILLKVNPAGSQLLYATYFGGSGTETLGGLAVDGSGNAYISGTTTSSDLPTTNGAFQSQWTPNTDWPQPAAAFVAKFTAGAKLSYATYLAGTNRDQAHGIAVDSAGNAYVAGYTASTDFPIVNAIQVGLSNAICDVYSPSGAAPIGQAYCASAGFLSVVNPAGTALLWSTYLGSGAAWALALDSTGNVYATGGNLDLTTSPIGSSPANTVGVLKIAPQGAGLQFSSAAITNGASFVSGLPLPGGLASIFVHGLNVTGTVMAGGFPLPTELAGVSVSVGGNPAAILAVANLPVADPKGMQQINFQAPFEAAKPGVVANLVEVRYQGFSTFAIPQTVASGIFVLSDGTPAIQHASDYSLVTSSNPVKKGETIIVYLTGLGPVSQPIATGVASTGADPIVLAACGAPYTSVGTTLYAGLTPGFAGLYQMNVQIGDSVPSGSADLFVYWAQCWLMAPPPTYAQSNTAILPIQ
jgi:uncharacterized protein (TIGR03437 family)